MAEIETTELKEREAIARQLKRLTIAGVYMCVIGIALFATDIAMQAETVGWLGWIGLIVGLVGWCTFWATAFVANYTPTGIFYD